MIRGFGLQFTGGRDLQVVDANSLVEVVASVGGFSMDWFCCFNASYSQVMISLRLFFV